MILAFLNIGTPEIILLVLAQFLFLALIAFIFRLFLSIPKIISLLKKQNMLLAEIAKTNNVPGDKISGIENSDYK